MAPTPDAFLVAAGVRKSFGGVQALRGAELAVQRGEVHSLVGANGSGKSTLLNVLSGQVAPDAGSLALDGASVRFSDPGHALAAGIAIVTQETSLAPHLSAMENILLGPRKARRGFAIDWRASRRRAEEILEPLGVDFPVDAPAGELRPDQQQMVEIGRAISMRARLLLLDEPTSSLTDAEVSALFAVVRALKTQGLTTIFVSHRMPELFEIVDRITILRDGRTVESGAIGDYTPDRLVERMVGHRPSTLDAASAASASTTTPALQVRDLSVSGHVRNATLSVGAGEVVGLAGLAGSGRSELLDAIFGVRSRVSGTIEVHGSRIRHRRTSQAIAHGLAYVPGDRGERGLVHNMTVMENLMMAATSGGMRLRMRARGSERSRAGAAVRDFGITSSSLDAPCATLSGGNQQKVVLAKWMATSPRVMLLDEPTRGVDVGAKAEIYRLLAKARESGMGTLVSSSESEELLLLCDRILVMFRGEIVAALDRERTSEAELTRYAMGHV